MKLHEKKEIFCDIRRGKEILNMTQKVQSLKKNDEKIVLKIKSFVL
jgi:hypothetical protein